MMHAGNILVEVNIEYYTLCGGSKQSSILYFSYSIGCITVLYESYKTV